MAYSSEMFLFSYCTVLFMFLVLEMSSQLVVDGLSVKYLPGFEGPLPFELETGYIGLGKADELQIYYYFVKSQSNPKTDPLILWFTGGPGCSSLNAFALELGATLRTPLYVELPLLNKCLHVLPFHSMVTYTSYCIYTILTTLSSAFPHKHFLLVCACLINVANIIFVELPVGNGFSYATTVKANHSDNLQTGEHAYQFLRKWLVGHHPEYRSNPFYVGGDSYGGMMVPIVTQVISDGIDGGVEPWINLKGYILGNPVTFIPGEHNYRIPFAHGMEIISDEQYKSLVTNCGEDFNNIDQSNDCSRHMLTFKRLTRGIFERHILEPVCAPVSFNASHSYGSRRSLSNEKVQRLKYPATFPGVKCEEDWLILAEYWANDDNVREALHIRQGTIGVWERCKSNLPFTQSINNSIAYHAYLSKKGLRSLIYSGDHDMVVPSRSTQAWIKSLNYSVVDDWRPWIVNGQVAGYTRSYSNQMTYATLKGSGHTAPNWTPAQCLAMLKRWLFYEAL